VFKPINRMPTTRQRGMLNRHLLHVMCVCCLFYAAGCSFTRTPEAGQIPRFERRPVLRLVEIAESVTESGGRNFPPIGQAESHGIETHMRSTLQESEAAALFSQSAVNLRLSVRLDTLIDHNLARCVVSGVICGVTLGLAPTTVKENYKVTLVGTVRSTDETLVKEYELEQEGSLIFWGYPPGLITSFGTLRSEPIEQVRLAIATNLVAKLVQAIAEDYELLVEARERNARWLAAKDKSDPHFPERMPDRQATVGFRWSRSGNNQIWALLIGISDYENENIPNLSCAADDAKAVYSWLVSREALGLPADNIRLLTDKEATLTNIKSALRDLRRQGIVEEDMLFVYFSGHGAPEVAADGSSLDAKYLLPYEADPDNLYGTAIRMDSFGTMLDDSDAKTQVVALDACYAGAVGRRTLARADVKDLAIRPKSMSELAAQRHRIILSAVTGRQVAVAPRELNHSLFTYYFLQALRSEQVGTLRECYEYLHDRVRRAAKKYDATQDPQWIGQPEADVILKPEQ